jgi:hypothetical protein
LIVAREEISHVRDFTEIDEKKAEIFILQSPEMTL